MPLPCDSPSTEARQEFCRALKAHRERRQITLSQIAASTKIPAYLFAALERGDVSRWPKGLFRRSFFRDYARAIGLPAAETCEEFVLLFPDGEPNVAALRGEPADAAEPAARASDLRLALDTAWHGPRTGFHLRLLAAAMDAVIITLTGLAIAFLLQLDPPAVVTAVSFAYLILGTVTLDTTPAKYMLARRATIVNGLKRGFAPIAVAWRPAAAALSYLFGGGNQSAEPVEDPPAREWISDARRVGPAPRLRVRIKVSH